MAMGNCFTDANVDDIVFFVAERGEWASGTFSPCGSISLLVAKVVVHSQCVIPSSPGLAGVGVQLRHKGNAERSPFHWGKGRPHPLIVQWVPPCASYYVLGLRTGTSALPPPVLHCVCGPFKALPLQA